MSGTVYLGHPIDFAGDRLADFKVKATQVCSELHARGFSVYRPATAWAAQPPMSSVIQTVNHAALVSCNVAVFLWHSGCKSFGVPFEIGVAHTRGIPTVVMCDDPVGMRANSALFAWAGALRLTPLDAYETAASIAKTIAKRKVTAP